MEKDIEKEILEKNKTKKYRRIIVILSSLIGLLAIITLILSIIFVNKDEEVFPEKISIDMVNTDYCNPNDQVIGSYGLAILVFFDAKKHPKYDEWAKLYEIGDYFKYEDKMNLNKAFYETIKNLFSNLEYITSDTRYVKFNYSISEDTEETIEEARKKLVDIKNRFFNSLYYENCIQLAKEEYINGICIAIYLPTSIEE